MAQASCKMAYNLNCIKGMVRNGVDGGTMDTKPRKRLPRITVNAPVVIGFATICVVVQIASTLTGGAVTDMFFTFRPGSWANPLTYFWHVSHIFGHVGWDHLIGNMSFILLLGPLLEEKYGSITLLEIMLASALGCSIANEIIFPHGGIVGASGIVFTFILLSSVTSLREGEIPLTFILVTIIYIGGQLYGALFVHDHISYLGHIVGGFVGAAVGFLLPVKSDARSSTSIF